MHEQVIDKDEVISELQGVGINPTLQRVEIARLLFARPQHLSAEQVLEQVNHDGRHAVSKATVYNTLNLFARKGLVREVIVDPSKVFYDSNTSEHHHFYHMDTGNLIDVAPGQLNVSELPALPEGTEAVGVDVIIRLRSRGR
jgi:Fur family iron response transcriptional regulator